MPVYEGVLERLSGGASNLEGRTTQREYMDVGGKHLKNVELSRYHDELLKEAVGEEVAVSVLRGWLGGNQLIAIRTPRGVARPGVFGLVGLMIYITFLAWLAALIVGGILLGIGAGSNVDLFTWAGTAVIVIFFVWPFARFFRVFRARAAIKKSRAPVHPAVTQ